ncbi:amino acid permease [Microbacterium lacus]|uniref:APC family permease n=1 Tax=Microbacterium lacus TaxID=415217 RepID=UPI00384BEC0D
MVSTTTPETASTVALKREFTVWSAGAVAFAFISPIVALYSIFGLVLSSAGPAGWWAFPIVLVGQFLVALVFAELASRWPLEGSVYQWVRRLAPQGLGWMTGWLYAWTLAISTAAVSYGAALFIGPALGLGALDGTTTLVLAFVVLVIATVINTAGRRWIKYVVGAALVAELVGSIAVAVYLLIFHRVNSIDVLFTLPGDGWDLTWPAMAAAIAFVGWSFVGFESAGSIGEEVQNPRRAIPKAMIVSVVAVGGVVAFSALAVILAIPDLDAVAAGEVADPVVETLLVQLGPGLAQPIFILFLVAFLATLIAVQTSASRMVFALARDGALPFASTLKMLRVRDRMPVAAVIVVAVAAGIVLLTSLVGDVYSMLIGFTVGGFFATFALVMCATVWARGRRVWSPGPFSLGRLGWPVTIVAALWSVFEFVNIAWPRTPEAPWFINYAVLLMIAILAIVGAVVYVRVRARIALPVDSADDESTPTLETQRVEDIS